MNFSQEGQQVLLIKVLHANDTKKFRMKTCYFDELVQNTNSLEWIQPLPEKSHFYYLDEGDLIQIDDQNDLNEAITSCVHEQKSTTLKLILARTQQEAKEIMTINESMRFDTTPSVKNFAAGEPHVHVSKIAPASGHQKAQDLSSEKTISDLPSELMKSSLYKK